MQGKSTPMSRSISDLAPGASTCTVINAGGAHHPMARLDEVCWNELHYWLFDSSMSAVQLEHNRTASHGQWMVRCGENILRKICSCTLRDKKALDALKHEYYFGQ